MRQRALERRGLVQRVRRREAQLVRQVLDVGRDLAAQCLGSEVHVHVAVRLVVGACDIRGCDAHRDDRSESHHHGIASAHHGRRFDCGSAGETGRTNVNDAQ